MVLYLVYDYSCFILIGCLLALSLLDLSMDLLNLLMVDRNLALLSSLDFMWPKWASCSSWMFWVCCSGAPITFQINKYSFSFI